MNPQFFGQSDKPLFGVYHRARGSNVTPVRAAVICPPIGQEYVRTHWCLRLLAGQLSRQGIHVFRFDYTGIGDSAKSIFDVKSLEQWNTDIELASNQVKEHSGADSVMLIGLRTGATLAANYSLTSNDVNSLMLWEPVHQQKNHLDQWRSLHQQMLDLWICKMVTENNDQCEEILGSQYSRLLIDQLESVEIQWDKIQQPHFVFEINESNWPANFDPNAMCKVAFTDDEDSWVDLRQMETAWMRPQTTRKIVSSAVDTFERLVRFGILNESKVTGVAR